MRFWIVFFVCLGSMLTLAQSYQFKIIDPVICFDYNKNQLIVIEDSTYQIQISLTTKKVTKKPLYWDGQLSFNELRNEFLPISEKGSPIYFVDRGCGWLLELRNDSIVRIDQSFHHKNQFGGGLFMHKGEPHIIGGAGLFSYKSFITRYDRKLKQWYLENDGLLGLIICNGVFEKTPNKLNFVCTYDKMATSNKNQVLSYDFEQRTWKKLGEIHFFDTINKAYGLKTNGHMICTINNIYEFDLQGGKIHQYQVKNINTLAKVLKVNNHYVLLNLVLNYKLNYHTGMVEVYSINEFKKAFYRKSYPLYDQKAENQNPTRVWLLGGILIIISGASVMVWLFRGRLMGAMKRKCSPQVQTLLDFWVQKPNYRLELSEISDLVNFDQPSADTLKKRRENLLKQFSSEVSRRYGVREELVYTTEFHPQDKRMKILVLNSAIADRIKKEK